MCGVEEEDEDDDSQKQEEKQTMEGKEEESSHRVKQKDLRPFTGKRYYLNLRDFIIHETQPQATCNFNLPSHLCNA